MHNGPALINGSSADVSGRRFKPRLVPDQAWSDPDTRCDVHLTLPARAENVVLVRRVIGALAESMSMPQARVEDIKLAVTEACTNVVRHAYKDDPGRLDVVAVAARGGLDVVVTDDGGGIQPRAQTGGSGLGLPLMA